MEKKKNLLTKVSHKQKAQNKHLIPNQKKIVVTRIKLHNQMAQKNPKKNLKKERTKINNHKIQTRRIQIKNKMKNQEARLKNQAKKTKIISQIKNLIIRTQKKNI